MATMQIVNQVEGTKMELLWRGTRDDEVSALTTMSEIEELVATFEAIADEQGWIHDGQFRIFAQNAIYFRLNVEAEIAGGLQLIRTSATGKLPSHNVWPELPERGPRDAHILMLTVKPKYRTSRTLFWRLCAEMWRYCWRQEIKTLWLEATPATYRKYVRLGWPLKIIGESRMHWGEECFPCELDLTEAASELALRAVGSTAHRTILTQLFRRREDQALDLNVREVDVPPGIGKNRINQEESALVYL